MPRWFKERAAIRASALQLYGSSVAQARQPVFYAALEVPDTAEGRYEMIILHLFMLIARLKREGEPGQRLSQALMEAFVDDMDANLREMGVGDLTVPKRVKKATAGAYERMEDYGEAFDQATEDMLGALLQSRIFGNERHQAAVDGLAAYAGRAMVAVDRIAAADLRAGRVVFPAVVEE